MTPTWLKYAAALVISKRLLGLLLMAGGLLAGVGILAIDFVGAGAFSGIGPAQRNALAGAAVVIALGVSLLPLGDRLA